MLAFAEAEGTLEAINTYPANPADSTAAVEVPAGTAVGTAEVPAGTAAPGQAVFDELTQNPRALADLKRSMNPHNEVIEVVSAVALLLSTDAGGWSKLQEMVGDTKFIDRLR